MKLAGRWAWTNQYGGMPVERIIERAKAAKLDGLVLKVFDPDFEARAVACRANGIPFAVENYVYPSRAAQHGEWLAQAAQEQGAVAIVINAEVEWETGTGESMITLINSIRSRLPDMELYASVDTRGNRTVLPYQAVLATHCTAIMPMIYPGAFRPYQPAGYIERAFDDCLRAFQYKNSPMVIPTLQVYSWKNHDETFVRYIGGDGISQMVDLSKAWGYSNFNFYTIEHATDEEWAEVIALAPAITPTQPRTVTDADLDKIWYAIQDLQRGQAMIARAWRDYDEGNYEHPPYPPVRPS